MNVRLQPIIVCWLCILLIGGCGSSQTTPVNPAVDPTGNNPASTTGADTMTTDNGLPFVDPADVSGDIEITGSSTVFPLTTAIVEAFVQEGSTAIIDVRSTGTVTGFRLFCSGAEDVDIVNASRAINAEEEAECRANNRAPIAFRVGTDALAIVVNKANDFITALTFEQLAQIFSGAATTWSDVDPTYPAEPIVLFSPGTDSGTFDYFVEEIFDKDPQPIQNAPGILLSEDDYELVSGIVENPYAIGYFGYAYYREAQDRLNIVAIDDGSGTAVVPTEVTVESEEYPLARPLYIYSSASVMQAQPHVAAFINYYLTNVNDFIREVGYFPASEAALAEARQAFLSANP